jgi:hypothetical protein
MINVYPIKDIEEHIIEGTQCAGVVLKLQKNMDN